MLPIQPLLELGTLFLADDDVVIIATGEAHDELGTDEETDLADAVDVGNVLTIETEEEVGIELLLKVVHGKRYAETVSLIGVCHHDVVLNAEIADSVGAERDEFVTTGHEDAFAEAAEFARG